MGGGGRVGGVIFMSSLFYMFQSTLNTFAFGYIFIINLIYETFPYQIQPSKNIFFLNNVYEMTFMIHDITF